MLTTVVTKLQKLSKAIQSIVGKGGACLGHVSPLTDEWVSGWLKTALITLTIWDIFHVQKKIENVSWFLWSGKQSTSSCWIFHNIKDCPSQDKMSWTVEPSNCKTNPWDGLVRITNSVSNGERTVCVGMFEVLPCLALRQLVTSGYRAWPPAPGPPCLSIQSCFNKVSFISWKKASVNQW